MGRYQTAPARLGKAMVVACVAGAVGTVAAASNPFATQPKADEVFYQIMPITWRDGNNDPDRFGDLIGMRDGLDYLTDLGITAVYVNPVFPSPAYHGYQHGAADRINPRLGTEQDFLDYVNAAHAAGIEVYLDFVVYGINRDSLWYSSAFANPASPYDGWIAFRDQQNTDPQGYTFNTWNGDTVGFAHWDLRNNQASSLVTSWALKWLDPNNDGDTSDGVDGYRLDHVWINYGEGPDGWGYNLDDFWADWHAALRATKPDVFTFCEQHDWGVHGGAYLAQFDAAMTKPFEFAARDALWNETAAPLYHQMQQTVDSLPVGQGTYVGIIGDHDVDRLAWASGASAPETIDRMKAAAAVLMLQPFPPVIYAGDEIGMLGAKQSYGSDADDIPMREPFKWNAAEGAPMSRYQRLNPAATANQFSHDFDGRSVEEQASSGPLAAHKELIAVRHANVALRRGSYHAVPATDPGVWAFMRRYAQGEAPIADATQTLVAAINLQGIPVTTRLDLSAFMSNGATLPAQNIAPGGGSLPAITTANASSYTISLPAYSYALIQADLQRPPEPAIRLDGQLDDAYVQVAAGPAATLWAAYDAGRLFVATEPAGDDHDKFIVVAQHAGAHMPAIWAKDGEIAAYDAYLGNEADNGWAGWFDAIDASGPVVGTVLEASIDLEAQFGFEPESVRLAALGYLTGDGDPLDPAYQAPSGNGNGDVEASEYAYVVLADITPAPPCPADLAAPIGVLNFADVQTFLGAFGAQLPSADLAAPAGVFNFADVQTFLGQFGQGCEG